MNAFHNYSQNSVHESIPSLPGAGSSHWGEHSSHKFKALRERESFMTRSIVQIVIFLEIIYVLKNCAECSRE